MKRVKAFFVCALLAAAMGSCHLFEEYDDKVNVQIYFNESNSTVFVDGFGALTLRIEPPDGMGGYYTVDYTVANEDIAMITSADRRGLTYIGRKPGSTVITANVSGAEAKAVVNVIE